ncbi:hypothetical protein BDR07DRAFT_998199 [Suillus spraguei]|nr:hypothetical protein BDR07DRAFT_998199 [Suillus spraguei]
MSRSALCTQKSWFWKERNKLFALIGLQSLLSFAKHAISSMTVDRVKVGFWRTQVNEMINIILGPLHLSMASDPVLWVTEPCRHAEAVQTRTPPRSQPSIRHKYSDAVRAHVVMVFLLEFHCSHTHRREHTTEIAHPMPETRYILNFILHMCQLMTGAICTIDKSGKVAEPAFIMPIRYPAFLAVWRDRKQCLDHPRIDSDRSGLRSFSLLTIVLFHK